MSRIGRSKHRGVNILAWQSPLLWRTRRQFETTRARSEAAGGSARQIPMHCAERAARRLPAIPDQDYNVIKFVRLIANRYDPATLAFLAHYPSPRPVGCPPGIEPERLCYPASDGGAIHKRCHTLPAARNSDHHANRKRHCQRYSHSYVHRNTHGNTDPLPDANAASDGYPRGAFDALSR